MPYDITALIEWTNHTNPKMHLSITHNAPFRTEMCTFLFWMVHYGIWNRCVVGVVNYLDCDNPSMTRERFVSAAQSRKSGVAKRTIHDGWLGGPYMMWSEMTVKRQHYLYVLFIFKHYHSLPRSLFTSLWDPAISWIFKGTTSIIKIFQSLWNLTVEPPVKIQSNCFQTTHNCQMVKYLSEIH